MALDVQRNWDAAMAENLQRLTMKENNPKRIEDTCLNKNHHSPPRRGAEREGGTPGEPVYLPDEIIIQILEYISNNRKDRQPTLAACCLISRQWYKTSIAFLYHSPRLYGPNFTPFERTICPSRNTFIIHSPLAELIRVLDLSGLVHQASNSTTAKLLSRTKERLEVFIAPQRGFGLYALTTLGKCQRLKLLDLSLVCESPELPKLFKAVAKLDALETFRLPRSAGFGIHHASDVFPWPNNLRNLSLSGGIDAHFLHGVVAFPQTLTSLTIEHCPTAKGFAVTHLLRKAVAPLKNLKRLRVAHMPRLSGHALDGVLFLLPRLEELSVSVDYITPAIFDENHLNHIKEPLIVPNGSTPVTFDVLDWPSLSVSSTEEDPPASPTLSLRALELTYSGSPADIVDKISPLDIMIAIDDGVLPELRQVRVATSLMWSEPEAESLSDVLVEAASLQGGLVDEAGVWRFEG